MPKFKIITSDFHLGAGRQEEGNVLEDFTSDREFAALVYQVIAESNGKGADVELIFNGDMFEMFQLPSVDTLTRTPSIDRKSATPRPSPTRRAR